MNTRSDLHTSMKAFMWRVSLQTKGALPVAGTSHSFRGVLVKQLRLHLDLTDSLQQAKARCIPEKCYILTTKVVHTE
eukprot:4151210-Amphidinium_carterae.1